MSRKCIHYGVSPPADYWWVGGHQSPLVLGDPRAKGKHKASSRSFRTLAKATAALLRCPIGTEMTRHTVVGKLRNGRYARRYIGPTWGRV